ncbi:MAG: xylulokinase [Alphaproteobacteria bacterium]
MYIGIDLGTSGVKAVLVDDEQAIVDQETAPLSVSTPRPLWSEQDPADWWTATERVMTALKTRRGKELAGVRGFGLSGQMHGATLLDEADEVLRPCILWNDGRSGDQCRELEERVSNSREITGNLAMPGFTAPKLVWVAAHEPEVFQQTARVLLPKDYLRLLMTGERVSEMSDASGTMWLDVGRRQWSEAMIEACGLGRSAMPELVEGSEPSGELRAGLARAWGLPEGVVVAGGAGDQAAGAAGIGTVVPGRAFLSLGTSGVYFVAGASYAPNPERAVHAFCHCLPKTWHQMSVILSAASCLDWVATLTGADTAGEALSWAGTIEEDSIGVPLFLPYLTGERTPHNDPHAKGVFVALTAATDRAQLVRAVLEGVAFAFADGQDVLVEAGAGIDDISVIGGGARSELWGRILAAVLDRSLTYHSGGEMGPAFGAARLARLARTGESPSSVCVPPPVERVVEPDGALAERLLPRLSAWRDAYSALKPIFPRI